MSPIVKQIPNILTASRIFFAGGFLALFWMADHKTVMTEPDSTKLCWSFILFVIAGVTDVIDGPLARRWNVTSAFGRMFDPFVDKILIGGGFISIAMVDSNITGVHWWMVGVILGREVLVTYIRTCSEAQGKEFGANWAGKVKMFMQCITVGTIVMYIAYHQGKTWALWLRNISIWTTVIFTAFTAVNYLRRLKK